MKALFALLLSTTAALAQQGDPINQSGNVTPGHPLMVITNNVAGDAGTAAQGGLTGLGVTANGAGICQNSGPVTAGYNQICMGANPAGVFLSVNNYNGASGPLSLMGNIALPSLAGQVQCLQVNAVGVITGTGFPCGSGGGGGSIGGLNGQVQFNNNGVLGGIGTTSTNGSTIFFQSGAIALNGASSGFALLISQPVATGTIAIPNGTDTLAGLTLVQTLTNKTLASPVFSGTSTGTATFAGTYSFNGTNNFGTSSFLWNGITQTFPASGNLVGVADTQVLVNKSINGSEINSGTVLATYLPTATSAFSGIVQGDGSTLTITAGTISCTTATNSQIGCGQPDGVTITQSAGVWTAVAPAAASVTIGTTLVGGTASGNILYNNSGTLGGLTPTGTGNIVLAASPTLSGTIAGNLTFSGNLTATGLLTSATIAGSLCVDSSGHIINVSNQGCFGVGVLALNSLAGNLTLAAGTQQSVVSSGTTVTVAPVIRSYIAGLTLSNDSGTPNTVLDTAAGVATDTTNAVMINIGAFTKSISGAWASGSGANGMGNALTASPSTWYHVCLANNAGTPDEWFDSSATCSNRPAGISDTKYRRIGSFKTNASTQITAFTQTNDTFIWTVGVRDINNQTIGTTATTLTLPSVPTGVVVTALGNAFEFLSGSASAASFYPLFVTDQPVTYGTVQNVRDTSLGGGNVGALAIITNTSAQIRARGSLAAVVIDWYTKGWIDSRGTSN